MSHRRTAVTLLAGAALVAGVGAPAVAVGSATPAPRPTPRATPTKPALRTPAPKRATPRTPAPKPAPTKPAPRTPAPKKATPKAPAHKPAPKKPGSARPAPKPAPKKPAPRPAPKAPPKKTPTTPAPRPTTPRTPLVVRLTFDDGPNPAATPQILAILRRYHVPATFFMIGRNAAPNPALVRSVRAQGHAIGNHTYDHPSLPRLSTAAATDEITRTNRAIGGRVSCLRPPYGATGAREQALAARLGMSIVLWNIDTLDWSRPGVAKITAAATAPAAGTTRTRAILMHDGGGDRTQTIAALPGVIENLKKQGARFETVPACR